MPARVVWVVDVERAVAEGLAASLQTALPDLEIRPDLEMGTALFDDQALVVATWPSGAGPSARVLLLAARASPADAFAAQATEPNALVSRAEPMSLVADAVRLVLAGAGFVSPAVTTLLERVGQGVPAFTAAETRLLVELATRPDTRSRLANRLKIAPSTLDNHVASIKRKVLSDLLTSGNAPTDGYVSMEALIGWVTHHQFEQKT